MSGKFSDTHTQNLIASTHFEARQIPAEESPGIMNWRIVKVFDPSHPSHKEFPDGKPGNGFYFESDATKDAERLNQQMGHSSGEPTHDAILKDTIERKFAERGKAPYDITKTPSAGYKGRRSKV